MRLCTSIFEAHKASLMANAGLLDIIQTFINITKGGLNKTAYGIFNRFVKDSKEEGVYSVKEGVSILQGKCKVLVPDDKTPSLYSIKDCDINVNLTKGVLADGKTPTYGFYIVLGIDSALPSERNRVIHFSFDFDKDSASLFCISESSQKINNDLEKLTNLFPTPYELMDGENIEMCLNHFIMNILYKYMIPSSLETVYVSNLFEY